LIITDILSETYIVALCAFWWYVCFDDLRVYDIRFKRMAH